MEEAALTLAFTLMALLGVMLRVVLPVTLIVTGIIQIRKNVRTGIPILIAGILYFTVSLVYFIYSAAMYGL